jgi:type I restriction enzyme, S subunit
MDGRVIDFPRVSIGSLADPEPGSFKIGPFGSSLKRDELVDHGIPVVGIENVLANKFARRFRRFISEEKFEQLSQYQIRPGDVLVTTMGTVGRAATVPEGIETAIIDSHLFRMRLNQSKAFPRYLSYAINGYEDLLQELKQMASGAIMSGLNTKILKACTVPLPPVDEQRRIVAVLDNQMEAVERARADAEAQLEAAKALPAAYLRAVFSSSEAQQWQVKNLGDVGEIVSGVTLGRKLNGAEARRVPYLRVANVKDGYLDLSDVYEIEATEVEIAKCRLKAGDLLLTEGGDPDKLGRGTFWQEQISECIHQNHIFRIRLDAACFLPEFISAQLCSTYGKSYFLAHAKQTTGIATINQKVLRGFPLMAPPLSTQRSIAAMLNDQIASAELGREAIEDELDAINKLPAALLRRAFNGEL